MTESHPVAGPGPLTGARVATALAALVAVGLEPRSWPVRYRPWPRGPADGFAGGVPELVARLGPRGAGAEALGTDLLYVELELELGRGGEAFGLVLRGHRDGRGASWSAELDPPDAAALAALARVLTPP